MSGTTTEKTKTKPTEQQNKLPTKKIKALPTKRNEPHDDLQDLSTLIYGPPKIGKSSFAAKYPKALFLATEPGLRSLSTYDVEINSWKDFLEYCTMIAVGDHDFKTIIVDTVDILYKQCADYVCNKFNVKHESDMDFGKGHALVSGEFQRAITKLGNLKYGVVFISHAKDLTTKTRTGEITKAVPMLATGARKILIGFADLILFFDARIVKDKESGEDIEKRFIFTKATENFEAGDRTGLLPKIIPLDYDKFIEAFTSAMGKRKGLIAAAGKK
jgi:hypothetical protein